MSPFTDDDLKRLKEKMDQPGYELHTKRYKTLLARLEASERRNEYADKVIYDDGDSVEYSAGVYVEFEQADKAWRKACGK